MASSSERIEPDPLEAELAAIEPRGRRPLGQYPLGQRPLGQRILLWFVPNLTAFIASFCIMVLELVAGRVIARYLGSSLYTWTSVIGIVLAGITVGNLIGGRLADWFRPGNVLSVIFILGSLTCMAILFANEKTHDMDLWTKKKKDVGMPAKLFFSLSAEEQKIKKIDEDLAELGADKVAEREGLIKERNHLDDEKRLPWSMRIFFHVLLVFLLPATLLGMIGPVVAKMAIDQGRQIGRTVGNVYGWGALGSIAGTFATGYYFINAFSTGPIIYGVGIILGLVGVLYLLSRFWIIAAPAAIGMMFLSALPAIAMVFFLSQKDGGGPWEWVERDGRHVLREKVDPDSKEDEGDGEFTQVMYIEESQYTYIKIDRKVKREDGVLKELERNLVMDSLIHAEWNPDNPADLRYDYEKIYQGVTHRCAPKDDDQAGSPACLFIGGGGYVYPRYIRHIWPKAFIEVAELDPAVTAADVAEFGLKADQIQIVSSPEDLKREGNPIWIYHLDARNHVEDLLTRKDSGEAVPQFDFIFGDAFSFLGVPYHLTTVEFNEKVKRLLKPDTGVYMINIIDIFYHGKFLAAVYNTFRQTFGDDNVYVFSTGESEPDMRPTGRDTFIVIGSMGPLDLSDLPGQEAPYAFTGSLLAKEHLDKLRDTKLPNNSYYLTDDYAPVENLLEYVVNRWKS